MEDDDFADNAQQLLDVLDETLNHKKMGEMLSGADLGKLRGHRRQLALALAGYRVFHGYMKPRKVTQVRKIPSGALQGTSVAIALSGLATTLAGPGTATATSFGVGGATAATGTSLAFTFAVILAPFAVAVFIDQVILGGGSPADAIAEKLQEAVNNLIRDMAQIDATTKALAITAAEAAALTLDDLLTALGRAIEALRISAVVILLAELARRFPSCAHLLPEIERIARQIQRAKANPSLIGGLARQLRRCCEVSRMTWEKR